MSVSLDSSVLLTLWNREAAAPRVAGVLNRLAREERLLVCGAVYAELCGVHPTLDALLAAYHIDADPLLSLDGWRRAGQAHAQYRLRRQQSGGGLPRRILTDFLIGAHASLAGHALFTLNVADYGDFPEVPLLTLTP